MDNNQKQTIINALFLLPGLFFIVMCLWAVYQLHFHGPFRDSWEFFWLYQSLFDSPMNHEKWAALMEPYAGAHRLAITHILLSADWQWFSGKNHLPLIISLACQFSLLIGSCIFIRQQKSFSSTEKTSLVSTLAIILFSQSAVHSLVYVYMVQLYLAVFITWLACVCFFSPNSEQIKPYPSGSTKHFQQLLNNKGKIFWLLLIPAAFYSNFFSVSMILIPAFYYLFRKKYLISILTLLAAVIIIYWYLPESENLQGTTTNPSATEAIKFFIFLILNYLHFMLRYLSSPLSQIAPIPGIIIAGFTLVLLLSHLYKRVFTDNLYSRQYDIHLILCLLTLFIAFATAFGRFNPLAASEVRYQPSVIFFWFNFVQLIFFGSQTRLLKAFVVFAALLVFIPAQIKSFNDNLLIKEKVELANYSANLGITHEDAIRPVLSIPLSQKGLNPVQDFNSKILADKKAYYLAEPANVISQAECPISVTSDLEKFSNNNYNRKREFQWYRVLLSQSIETGNIILSINNRVYPARVFRKGLISKTSNELYFIAPFAEQIQKITIAVKDQDVCEIKL